MIIELLLKDKWKKETLNIFFGFYQSIRNALFPLWFYSFIKFGFFGFHSNWKMTQKTENKNALNHSKMYITSVQPKLKNLIEHLTKELL